VRRNAQGGLELFPNQSSGVLTSTVWADGLVDNPAARPSRAATWCASCRWRSCWHEAARAYFASVREAVGQGTRSAQTRAETLGALRDELIARGEPYAGALARGKAVRMALDQVMSDESRRCAKAARSPSSRRSPAAEEHGRPRHHPDRGLRRRRRDRGAARDDPGVGAVCSFIGTVRDRNDGSAGARWSWSTIPA
jgi:molybdopterin synthase sulfur carrier subunit